MPEYSEIASGGQANAEVAINENMALLSFLTVYGKKVSTSTGLNWGYYGGTWGPYDITAGTLTLTNTATNYIVVARATGVISVSTTNTGRTMVLSRPMTKAATMAAPKLPITTPEYR